MTTNNTFNNQNREENNTFYKTNVANNVAQRNSQDLTEQWKKGELKKGWYYYKASDGRNDIATDYGLYCVEADNNVELEVLAPVPSYEEWQGLNKDIDTITELWKHERSQLNEKIQLIGKLSVQAVDLNNEIKQLKELLKECREYIGTNFVSPKMRITLTEIDEVLK